MIRLRHTLLFISLFMLICTSCHRTTARQLLGEAETLLEQDSLLQASMLLRKVVIQAEAEADWHTQYIALQRQAEAIAWSNTDEALRLMLQALEVYRQHPDNERNHVMLLDYAGTYAAQKAYNDDTSFDEALRLTQRAYQLADSLRDNELRSQTLTTLANIHWAREQYGDALNCARRADSLAVPSTENAARQVLARCYLSQDSLAQAEAIYKSMPTDSDIHMAYIVQSNLANIAVRLRDADAAEAAIDSAFEEAERLYFNALEQKDDYYQTVIQQEKHNDNLRLWVSVSVLAIVLLLALAAMFYYRLRLSRARQRHRLQLMAQETQRQQEQLAQAQEVIHFLQQYILQRSEALQKLSQSDGQRISLSHREWADVERTLNAIDGQCIALIRQMYPDMSDEDLQLCILVRLKLSNRAIGSIFCITISAVQHRKTRIKKEVFGEQSPDVTLEQVLERLPSRNPTISL
ncbi:MAG: hypothetical protein Q4E32_09280 [Bacteroidales bacterium]|nr:hypothetical protein [Bacteroidales bacterium]